MVPTYHYVPPLFLSFTMAEPSRAEPFTSLSGHPCHAELLTLLVLMALYSSSPPCQPPQPAPHHHYPSTLLSPDQANIEHLHGSTVNQHPILDQSKFALSIPRPPSSSAIRVVAVNAYQRHRQNWVNPNDDARKRQWGGWYFMGHG